MNDLKGRFDSIIFDLDGTLWDSTANVAHAWQTAKEQVNYIKGDITREQVAGIAGMAYDAIFEHLFPYLDNDTRNTFKAQCAKNELEILHKKGGELYPALEETLHYLKSSYKLFVVSNCQSSYIEIFLDLNDLHKYFEGHQCYGTKGQPKWQNIKDIVNDHQLTAPVYVGDTTGDQQSSAKAGVPFIFAAYGFGNIEEGTAVATINQFADLKELL